MLPSNHNSKDYSLQSKNKWLNICGKYSKMMLLNYHQIFAYLSDFKEKWFQEILHRQGSVKVFLLRVLFLWNYCYFCEIIIIFVNFIVIFVNFVLIFVNYFMFVKKLHAINLAIVLKSNMISIKKKKKTNIFYLLNLPFSDIYTFYF